MFAPTSRLYSEALGLAARHGMRRVMGAAVLALVMTASLEAGPAGLDARLTEIRHAICGGDVPVLARQFWDGGPVYVSMPSFQRGAFLGPGPLRALLERIVRETSCKAFRFAPADPRAPDTGDDAYVKAKWTYVDRRSTDARTQELNLSLRRRPDGEWRIVQIRTTH